MQRLIDAVFYLSKQELAFRGHNERGISQNKGNYVELLHVLENYDHILRKHFTEASVFIRTSKHVQNDLICCIAKLVTSEIMFEINAANFVAIELDESLEFLTMDSFRWFFATFIISRFLSGL